METFRNRLRKAWAAGRTTLNGWLAAPSIHTAEVMARAGWDSLTIDLQHGLVDYQAAAAMLPAISTTDTLPLARVPWLEEGIVMKMLDAGCHGIICPMINSADSAARFARACLYPPFGCRSFGPVHAKMAAAPDYLDRANEELLSIAMIETREALDRLDAILGVEELSAVYVGPSDLSLSLGFTPKLEPEDKIALAYLKDLSD